MQEYDVTIRETLERTVSVQAASREEAEAMVEEGWNNSEYVLDADDFTGVEFSTSDGRSVEREKLSVLLVEPEKYPRMIQIENTLEALQAAVGGNIEVTYPFEDAVGLILNEEGKLSGLPLNRALRDEDGQTYDILVGDFLVVGLTEESFGSLTPEQAEKYEKHFHQPEAFVRLGRGIITFPIDDETMQKRQRVSEQATAPRGKIAPEKDVL